MNIALCMTGSLCKLISTKNSILNLLKTLDCEVDIFINTYSEDYSLLEINNILKGLENIKDIHLENNTNNSTINLLDRMRKMELVMKQRLNYEHTSGKRYDICIQTTADLLYLSTINLNEIKPNVVYVSNDYNVYIGDIHTIDTVVNNQHETIKKLFGNDIGSFSINEKCILHHMVSLFSKDIYEDYITTMKLCTNNIYTHEEFKCVVENKNVCLITSAINLQRPSFFTPNERYNQTLNTINTVRDKISNSYIILLEGTFLSNSQQEEISLLVDEIVLYNDDRSKRYINHTNKSVGEIYMLINTINKISNSNTLWKISGRYYLTNMFHEDNYKYNNKICVKSYPERNCINTTLYRVGNQCIELFKLALSSSLTIVMNNNNIDVEHTIYSFIDEQYFQDIYTMGIEGFISGDGDRYNI